jgi:hypothetical protein
VDPDDRAYAMFMQDDLRSDTIFLWDRGWPSEHIYGKLLDRDRRLRYDPWLGEFIWTRSVRTNGLAVMVMTNPRLLLERRDESDLPVDPFTEQSMYIEYARKWGWDIVNSLNPSVVDYITMKIVHRKYAWSFDPAVYAGPTDCYAGLAVVEKWADEDTDVIGAFAPIRSWLLMRYARSFGERAPHMGWTYVEGLVPELLEKPSVIYVPTNRVRETVKHELDRLNLSTPILQQSNKLLGE